MAVAQILFLRLSGLLLDISFNLSIAICTEITFTGVSHKILHSNGFFYFWVDKKSEIDTYHEGESIKTFDEENLSPLELHLVNFEGLNELHMGMGGFFFSANVIKRKSLLLCERRAICIIFCHTYCLISRYHRHIWFLFKRAQLMRIGKENI